MFNQNNPTKILYVLAHLDDELFCAGSIIQNLQLGHKVIIFVTCGITSDENLIFSFKENMKLLSEYGQLHYIINDYNAPFFSEEMNTSKKQQLERAIDTVIRQEEVSVLYTHSSSDLHPDHEYVSNLCKIITRPKRTSVKTFIEFCVPGSFKEFFGNLTLAISAKNLIIIETLFENYAQKHLKFENSFGTYEKILKYNAIKTYKQHAENYKIVYMIC